MTLAACKEKLVEFAEPIVVLEARRFRKSKEYASLVVVSVLLLIAPFVLLVSRDQLVGQFALGILGAFFLLAILLMIPSQGGRSIQREREVGSWDLLVLTPLKACQIVDQKTFAVAAPTLVLLAAGLPACLVAAVIAGVSVLDVLAFETMFALAAMGVSYWSVQASFDCGRSAIWVAYLPALSYLCSYLSCGGYLVALGMLFNPQFRAQAGRMLLAAICLHFVLGALAITMMKSMGVFQGVVYAPWIVWILENMLVGLAVCLQVAGLIAMRYLLIWSVESGRRV